MNITPDDVIVSQATGDVWIVHAILDDPDDPDVTLHHADRRQAERDTCSSLRVLEERVRSGELRHAKFPQTITAIHTRNGKVVTQVSGPTHLMADVQLVEAAHFGQYCEREAAAGRTVRPNETDHYLTLQPNRYGLEAIETNTVAP